MCTLIFALRIMLFLGNLLKTQVSATRILMTAFTMVLVLNLQRVIPEVITASFEIRLFHYLHISVLEKRHVVEPIDCSFACLQNVFCVSFNAAAVADGKGKYWCELLSRNMHSDAAKLAANYQSHHYSLSQNSCGGEICSSQGKCRAISSRDGPFECVCHPGYVGKHCEIAAPECLNHKVLSEPDRHISYGRGQKEDSSLIPGWYRFQSYLYEKMLNYSVGHHKCHSDLTGWLKGSHPSIENGIVDREVCFFGYNNCCYRRVHVRVRKCNGFYVYFLKPSPPGNFRYCAV
ncbi:unnamed protein product [Pocillopora meandrina]|uniref:EGF-like domain-containing protein n=1 Tax=Pocillopora meandrina TaxID=46732 RepID=A0AAU9XCT8_9CNID|nr:unnamed protein product [Pocillopora meandrina]